MNDAPAAELIADQHTRQATIARLRRLTNLLDTAIGVPGTAWQLGLDAIIGLVPGVGDAITAACSLYIVAQAHRLGVPRRTMFRMIFNVGADVLVGSIPVLGDIFDVFWKCNLRNLRLLEKAIADDVVSDAKHNAEITYND